MNDMAASDRQGPDQRPTPVMAQYLEIKAAHPDCLLFYRMGDFYELFFADAEVTARDLGIALTKRGKYLGDDIPMCGVPIHAADGYLQRLIRLGHRVAVCEQLEDPAEARKRGSKAVVRRDVVRLVTPGTLTEDSLLESRAHNYLAALTRLRGSGEMALAWADISSGELAAMTTGPGRLATDIARIDCREIVIPDSLADEKPLTAILSAAGIPVTPVPGAGFDSISAEHRLRALFEVSTLDAFGTFSRAETACLGGLLSYITLTQAGRLPFLRRPRRYDPNDILVMDAATRANLELTRTLAGERKGSLLSVIDMTVTAGGARLLATRLATPLSDHVAITNRLDDVSFFTGAASLRDETRECLAQSPDIERGLARLSVGRGGPRDLAVIRDGILQARQIAKLLIEYKGLDGLPKNIRSACDCLASDDSGLLAALQEALADDLPLLSRDGGFIRPGFSPDLDENRALRDDTKQVIAELQQRYAEDTGIKSIKIRHNNVLGYFIEVTAQNAMVLQSAERACKFIHRQTVASAVRFTTIELSSLEQRISSAANRSIAIEREILEELVRRTIELRVVIAGIAEGLSVIDVSTGLALLAERQRYVRPKIDDSTAFRVRAGRHPVVEAALRGGSANSFVANDCCLSDEGRRLWLITGPNMAGKSTFLRQNALIVILAQIGSFVPADEAHIGIVDRLFSRVGAADDLARGRSTFMVEMVETAAILNQATLRSFVILDEIGRGTATFDGLSIAWATIENLHDVNQCRTLFATHYHELTALASRLKQLSNMTVKVREWHGDVVFLHEVGPGIADRSYGIQVARLAGLPAAVVARASEVLGLLEKSGQSRIHRSMADDLPLFSAARREDVPQRPPVQSELERRLAAIVPDELSPREALTLLYEIKTILQESARA